MCCKLCWKLMCYKCLKLFWFISTSTSMTESCCFKDYNNAMYPIVRKYKVFLLCSCRLTYFLLLWYFYHFILVLGFFLEFTISQGFKFQYHLNFAWREENEHNYLLKVSYKNFQKYWFDVWHSLNESLKGFANCMRPFTKLNIVLFHF